MVSLNSDRRHEKMHPMGQPEETQSEDEAVLAKACSENQMGRSQKAQPRFPKSCQTATTLYVLAPTLAGSATQMSPSRFFQHIFCLGLAIGYSETTILLKNQGAPQKQQLATTPQTTKKATNKKQKCRKIEPAKSHKGRRTTLSDGAGIKSKPRASKTTQNYTHKATRATTETPQKTQTQPKTIKSAARAGSSRNTIPGGECPKKTHPP